MVEILEQLHCQHPNGKNVFLYTLKNEAGTIVHITNYGAIIMAIKVKKSNNNYNDIVLGFAQPSDYWSEKYLNDYPYFGAAIGRYGNRIDKAEISIDGMDYQLGSPNPGYQLHGGIEGFDKKVWERVPSTNDELVLQYISPDGEEGFPGELTVQIVFKLNDDNELSYEYKGTTTKPTAVNLTHHSYFNLNNGSGNILNHHLKIDATTYLEQDANFCTTGKTIPVAGTRNDFRTFTQTGNIADADTGIDISFPRNSEGIDNIAAEAYCDEEDVKLQVLTTEPLVHLYNSRYVPPITGKNNIPYGSFSGFCFETQKHPNAIRIQEFPNTILRPGEAYYTKTIYKLVKK